MDKAELKRKQKQKFLKNVIIEHKYDQVMFTDYIERKKSNAGDIDRWNQFELERIVEEFKRIPSVYFEHATFKDRVNRYQSIKVKPSGNKNIEIQIKELNKTVIRTLNDFEWLIKTMNNEFPSLFFPKINFSRFLKKNKIDTENLYILKYYCEYLFVFYFGINSSVLKNFFNYSEEEFTLFRQVGLLVIQDSSNYTKLYVFYNEI